MSEPRNESLEDTIAAALCADAVEGVPTDYRVEDDFERMGRVAAVAVREWEASREPSDEEIEAAALAMYGGDEWGSETIAYIKAARARARVALRAASRIRT